MGSLEWTSGETGERRPGGSESGLSRSAAAAKASERGEEPPGIGARWDISLSAWVGAGCGLAAEHGVARGVVVVVEGGEGGTGGGGRSKEGREGRGMVANCYARFGGATCTLLIQLLKC